MDETFKQWTFYLAAAIEAGAGVVIGLAAIVVLRTVLNYFLQKEIDKAAERHPEVSAEAGGPTV